MQSPVVAHLTSVHSRFDTRIYLKECSSLAAAGYEVFLIVADGLGDAVKNGVRIRDVGRTLGRIERMIISTRRVLALAIELDADIYHIHDPELLTVVGQLKRRSKIVIFDAHENTPAQIRGKTYLHPFLRHALSRMYALYEARACRGVDAIVTATPVIRDKFSRINRRTVDINNYPILDELVCSTADLPAENQICYVGGIDENRGIREVVHAMELMQSNARLLLCGSFGDKKVESEVKRYRGWEYVDDLGWLDRDGVREVLHRSVAGLVTFHALPNHVYAQPNKMFEYMSASVAVIGSDFPLWRKFIEGNRCGICVDPRDPQAIAGAIDYLIKNPLEARKMGDNGRKAVQSAYNWFVEERKLLDLYQGLVTRYGHECIKGNAVSPGFMSRIKRVAAKYRKTLNSSGNNSK